MSFVGVMECKACSSEGCNGGSSCDTGYEVVNHCLSCTAGFYSDGSGTLFRCLPCRSAPIWVIVLLVLGFVAVAAIYLKLNSTRWFERMTTPLRIGFVHISVISMLKLVRLQWPGGLYSALSGLQVTFRPR